MAAAGFEVVYPRGLSCCGLAVHSAGDDATAKQMAIRNIKMLSQFPSVVTGCATCGSALKAYGAWFPPGSEWHQKAMALSQKVVDFSQLLSDRFENHPKRTVATMTVTFHDPCHLKQHQSVAAAPRNILKSLPGIAYVEMDHADACCGLGGSFGISHMDISREMQHKKIDAIIKSGAQAVVTACPGCQMYLADGLKRRNVPVRVMHIAELLGQWKK